MALLYIERHNSICHMACAGGPVGGQCAHFVEAWQLLMERHEWCRLASLAVASHSARHAMGMDLKAVEAAVRLLAWLMWPGHPDR